MTNTDEWATKPGVALREHGRQSSSYGRLADRVAAVSTAVARRAPVGSVVPVVLDNSQEAVELTLGIMRAGCVALPFLDRVPPAARAAIARAAGATAPMLGVGGELDPHEPGYERALASATVTAPAEWESGGVVWASSGSTGRPKLVMHSYHSLRTRTSPDLLEHTGYLRGHEVFTTVPLGATGILPVLMALEAGGTVVLDPRTPTPNVVLEVLGSGTQVLVGRPLTVRRLLETGLSRRHMPGLRYVHSGSMPIPPAVEEMFETQMAGATLVDLFSSTELGLISARHVPEQAGTVVDNIDLEVREDGQIWARGQGTMRGFFEDGTFTSTMGQWLTSGDYGDLEDGRLVLLGRQEDKILVSGFTVYAASVERVLAQVPGVDDVAVIGRAHDRAGQIPVAFVVGTASDDELLAFANENLPSYAVPMIKRIESLPKTPGGKVLTRELA